MALSAIILEDEPLAASMLEQILEDIQPAVTVLEKCNDVPSAVKGIIKHKPDIVFVDIELPVYNGTQLVEFFDAASIDFDIIFTTAYNEYALKAFELSAVDYLLKPLQADRIQQAVNKVRTRQGLPSYDSLSTLRENMQGTFKKIVVSLENGYQIVSLDDIMYIEASGAWSKIFFQHSPPLTVSKPLKHFKDMLDAASCFGDVHRSFIVNLKYAEKLISKDGWSLILNNKAEIPVAQSKKDEILEKLKRL